ncbi:MAG: radical SAM protein [Elusimicrobia bacterium]|nr:radical SAM protein [Elusimicrobiota bacterium]
MKTKGKKNASITDKIDAITAIPKDWRKTVLPAPRSVKIELTGRCNYQCGFCALRMRPRQPLEDIRWDFFTRITREMRGAGVEELGMFFLGESFMAGELLAEAIRYAKKDAGFPYIFLTTNGSLAGPDIVRRCMEAGLDSLKWSLNNSDEEQFKRITGVKSGLWRESIANLKAARKVRDEVEKRTGHRCGLYASSIRYDGEQQNRMESLVKELSVHVDEHYWLPLYSMGSLATQREKELGYRPIAGNQGRLARLREPLPCWSAFTEGHVTSTGMLSACCFDADERWTMADLNKVSFMEGWNSRSFQRLRKAHLAKDVTGTVCERCVAYQRQEP